MNNTAACYDNPAVIDLSNGTEVPYTSSCRFADDTGNQRQDCKSASPLSAIGFALLALSGIMCCVGAFVPMWIYYPRRPGVPELDKYVVEYPFRLASWRGLWAVCYNYPDLKPQITQSRMPQHCAWFGQSDNDAWATIPS